MVNFCETCGFQLASSSAGFCGNCGRSINPGPSNEAALAEEVGESIQSGNKGVPGAYRLSKWKGWLTGLLSAQALVVFIIATVALSRRSAALDRPFSLREFTDADEAVEIYGNAGVLVGVATIIVLIMWSWRVAKNTHLWSTPRGRIRSERRIPRHSTGWAIGGWFIPVANLVIPYRILSDGWRLTPQTRPGDSEAGPIGSASEPKDENLRSLLIGWLGFWFAVLVGIIGNARATAAESYAELAQADAISAVAAFIRTGSLLFVLIAIRRISDRHDNFASL